MSLIDDNIKTGGRMDDFNTIAIRVVSNIKVHNIPSYTIMKPPCVSDASYNGPSKLATLERHIKVQLNRVCSHFE